MGIHHQFTTGTRVPFTTRIELDKMSIHNIVSISFCICALILLLNGARAQNGVVTDVVDANRGRTAIFALYAGDTVVKNDGREKTLASVKVTLYRVGESGDVAVSQMKSDEVG